MKSIVQKEKKCIICESEDYLEKHHCFFGANRKVSERLGLVVWLCMEHHRGDYSPHRNRRVDIWLKLLCQKEYLKTHTEAEWLQEIGKVYQGIEL